MELQHLFMDFNELSTLDYCCFFNENACLRLKRSMENKERFDCYLTLTT